MCKRSLVNKCENLQKLDLEPIFFTQIYTVFLHGHQLIIYIYIYYQLKIFCLRQIFLFFIVEVLFLMKR